MNMIRRLIIAFIAAVASVLTSEAAVASLPKGWDSVDPPASSVPLSSDETGIVTRDGYVYVMSARQVKVCIFTVLGQPLTEVTLPAGCHRFRISSRGIYILRADSSTFRITI